MAEMRIRRVGGALAALVLLTASGSAASPTTRQEPGQQPGCAYTPIPVAIPPGAHYPPEFSQREAREERPPARSRVPTYGLEELKDPPELKSTVATEGAKQVRSYDPLEIQYTKPDATKLAGCGLTLRTYNGGLVGPTMRVKPGQTMKFKVTTAKLCEGGPCPPARMPDYDMTNLHTHGLHVDPGSYFKDGTRIASDDVLITYRPPEEQQYEIAIPSDHAPGNHWYHAHAHESTAIQVASGMAGALIVEDDKDSPDFPASLKNVTEKVMVFQSLFYDREGRGVDPLNPPPLDPSNPGGEKLNWQNSNRRITINGQIVPKITMRPGEVQRWRMVGSMFQELLELQLADHNLNEIATDGFYLPKVDTWKPGTSVDLHAGYRSDVLVKASDKEGTYILADRPTPVGVMNNPAESRQAEAQPSVLNEDASALAAVVVTKDPSNPPVATALPTDAEMKKISYDRAAGVEGPGNSLEDQWKKDPVNQVGGTVQPGAHIQVVHFNLGQSANYDDGNHFAIDHKVYPTGGVRKLTLDRIDRWELITETPGPHLFHIHINPFQMIRAGPDGADERIWKDTITVRQNISINENSEFVEKPLIVYTKYTVFTGKFVIHCHLLHHEDNGMMQQVELVKP